MSKRTPAASTLLKQANEQLAALQKKLTEKTTSYDSLARSLAESREEIEQVHALLDALPGAAGRKTEAPESWNQRDLKTMTRLAAYLANRGRLPEAA